MRQNRTLAKLRQNQPTIGLWLHSHHAPLARIIASQKIFDWLLLDLEHTPVDPSITASLLGSIADVSTGLCTPLVRVVAGTQFHIKQALDSGAQGIIVPMINTPDEVRDVVRFSRYPPMGERGAGGVLPQYSFGSNSHIEYVQAANQEIMVAIQIETKTAVANIDAILDVPGLDMVFIGPFDLHVSLTLTPTLWSDIPAFQVAVQKVIAACRRHNLPYGTIAPDADGVLARLQDGFTFVSMGTDVGQLLYALHTQYQQIKLILDTQNP